METRSKPKWGAKPEPEPEVEPVIDGFEEEEWEEEEVPVRGKVESPFLDDDDIEDEARGTRRSSMKRNLR